MSGLHDKVLGAVLCAVLVFWCAFPVPVGVRPVDEFTHEEADAVAPAIPVIVVFGTALAAAGVYAAGASTGAYNNNLQALYNDFMRFAANEGSANAANFDSEHMESTLSGAVTSSNKVDLGVLAASGMFGLLPSFLSWNGLSGSVNVGSTSYIESSQVVTFDGVTLGTMTGKWPDNSYTQELTNYNIALSKGYVIAAYVCYTGQYNRQMRGYIWTSNASILENPLSSSSVVGLNASTSASG